MTYLFITIGILFFVNLLLLIFSCNKSNKAKVYYDHKPINFLSEKSVLKNSPNISGSSEELPL